MKTILRFLAAFLGLCALELHAAGSLRVNLSPSSAVGAGAQWRVDGGGWRNSGATVNGLSSGTHNVDFKTVSGWVAPATTTATVTNGNTTTLAAAYVQTAALTLTLTPSGGQWSLDGGAWRASGATVTGLTPGSHTVSYSSVAGYASPATETVSLSSGQTTTLTRSYTQLAQLSLALTPGSAQWRVDGGTWTASGATVANLAPGTHTVDYNGLTGYTAPASESVTLTAGQSLSLARAYVQLAQVTLTLNPASAQWRLNGGAWQASGGTLANLTPGSYPVEYLTLAVPNWGTPPTETLTLSAGQSLTLTRNYTPLGQVSISLVPSTGTWRLNGGAWQASGTSLWVPAGTYTADYSSLADYDAPPADTFANGFGATRYYTTTKPTLRVHLVPSAGQWRVDGGAWQTSGAQVIGLTAGSHSVDYTDLGGNYNPLVSETIPLALRENAVLTRAYPQKPATLTVNLTPASGYWLLNGPTASVWRASGETATGLTPASNYTIQYSSQPNYLTPPTEPLTLTPAQVATISRNYAPMPASLRITTNLPSGQWRIYPAQSAPGGAWNNNADLLTGLAPGDYVVEYNAVTNYTAPSPETLTLSPNQSADLTRAYTALPAQVTVTLSVTAAQWRIFPVGSPAGPWKNSGATATGLAAGSYTIEYSGWLGYDSPPTEDVTLTPGQVLALSRTYPPRPAQIRIVLTPNSAQWRIYAAGSTPGGTWQSSGATVSGLAAGNYTVEYSPLAGYDSPPTDTFALAPGDSALYTRLYSAQPAQITVITEPASCQWRIYPQLDPPSGGWNASGATVTGLGPYNYTIGYAPIAGYTTPTPTNVTFAPGENKTITTTYAANPAQITVTLNPSTAQWRVDGGTWKASGTSATGLAAGNHTLEFSAVAGYTPPSAQTITLNPGETKNVSFTYVAQSAASLTVTLTPSSGQWRVDGGTWQASAATVGNLTAGSHLVEFSHLVGYTTPAPVNVSLAANENRSLSQTHYPGSATISVSLASNIGRWRVDGWTWAGSGWTWYGGSGTHTIDYEPVLGYAAPPAENLTLDVNDHATLSRAYTQLPQANLTITLNPSQGQWRIYQGGTPTGAWQNSGAPLAGIEPGTYTIEYSAVPDYGTPASESITLAAYQVATLTRTYATFPGQVTAHLTPAGAQWRISPHAGPFSSTWLASGTTVSGLNPGNYLVEYQPVAGYITPSNEVLTLSSTQSVVLNRDYRQDFQLSLTLYPSTAQWRVDGGDWQPSGGGVINLTPDVPHTIDYSTATGYVAPASETVTLWNGQQLSLYRYYTPLSQLTINLYPSNAQWRIDGGAWQNSGATVANLTYDVPHTIDYATVTGYVAPASETVTLWSGQQLALSRYHTPLSQLTLNLYPSNAQWRVDGGAWQNSGTTVVNLAYDVAHTIDYATVTGYVAPASETVTLWSGQQLSLSRYHTPLSQLTLNLYPSNAQWRVDGGAWQNSGATVVNLAYDVPHSITYSTVAGYIAPASESVTLWSGQQLSLSRYHTPFAQVTVSTSPSHAQWRVDGGAWQDSGTTAGNLAFDVPHTVDFRPMAGYSTPVPQTFTPYSGQLVSLSGYYYSLGVHRLRIFVHQDLAGSLPLADVRSRTAQYAAHLTQIFTRETLRTFAPFDPQNDVAIVSADPFSGSSNGWMPDAGFELWVYATLTDNATVGTYGGSVGVDTSGAGGARDVKFDQLYDPSALTDNTPALAQYWRQLHLVTRHLERTFGAGPGGYDSLGGLHDASGVAPVVADVAAVDSASPDAFWNARFDYWTDPLTANAYANPRLGSPTSLATLLALTSFAPATRGVINSPSRNPDSWSYYTLPNLGAVVVKIVNAQTGAPLTGSTLRVWNRQNPSSPTSTYEETVTPAGTAGVFHFSWTGSPTPLTANDNAKLLKASVPGYTAAAQWITIYDAQKVKLIDGQPTLEITIPLTPQ